MNPIWDVVLDAWALTVKLMCLAKVIWANLSNFALEQSEGAHNGVVTWKRASNFEL